jgi:heat shock protein HslJ
MSFLKKPAIGFLIWGLFLLGSCVPVQPEGSVREDTPPSEGTAKEKNLLNGTQWQLVAYGNPDDLRSATAANLPKLTFHQSTLDGSTGCNNYGSAYLTSGDSLSLDALYWTEMECLGPELMQQEAAYLALLGSIETYQLEDDSLILSSPDGILHFAPIVSAPERALVRKLWRLETIVEAAVTDVIPKRIEERFLITAWFEDRRIGGQTGCNHYSAPYEITGELLDLSSGPMEMTAAGCIDEESARLEQRFTTALVAAETYRINGDRLTITFPGGELIFVAQEEISADENAVYTAIIREWDGGQGPYVILKETRFNKAGTSLEETLTFVRGQLPPTDADDPFTLDPTTLIDFEQKNTASGSLNEVLSIGLPVTFIAEDELEEILNTGEDADWARFRERFPETQGVFTFSRVGFNEAGDQVLVYLGIQREDFSGGYYSILVERESLWFAVMSFMIWDTPQDN